jgi:diketogulonate reductase-like aldo/keto reductase
LVGWLTSFLKYVRKHMSGLPNSAFTRLANGVDMPRVGFGCAGKLTRAPIGHALAAGYRLFDTSQATEWYLEEELGVALNASGIARSAIFLTTKLHPRDLGEDSTLAAFPTSLRRLRTTYVDAFLLHYPRCFGSLCGPGEPHGTWRDSWRALETLYERGEARAIGVSNLGVDELNELFKVAKVRPHIVQSWMDPLQQARPLRKLCASHGVLFQAYSTLGTQWAGQGVRINPVLKHPAIGRIAREVERSPAQVALRWALQRGAAVIPRSTKPKHIAESLNVFDFSLLDEQMSEIDALDGTDPKVIRAPPPPPRTCLDESDSCGAWADAGECENNPSYMHKSCAASCDTCPTPAASRIEL